MSDQAVTGGDVFLIAASGGAPRNLTEGRAASPSAAMWTADGTLLVTEWYRGGSRIARLDAATGAARVVWTGDEDCHADGYNPTFSASADGTASAFSAVPSLRRRKCGRDTPAPGGSSPT